MGRRLDPRLPEEAVRLVKFPESAECDDDGFARATAELLHCGCELWRTQRRLLGGAHPECAQTLHDIGSAIQELLTRAPQLLFRRHPDWGSAALAAHAERAALRLHKEISALYAAPLPTFE